MTLREWRDEVRGLWSNWIVVGCGGVTYQTLPYLKLEARNVRKVSFVDPDTFEARNRDRQWPEAEVGQTKVAAAVRSWGHSGRPQLVQPIREKIEDVDPGRLVLPGRRQAICIVALPDNDAARLRCCILGERLVELFPHVVGVGVVTAGNETWRGQAFWGAMGREGWVYDWREPHREDVTDDAGRGVGCGQVPQSNVQTAACLSWAIREMLHGTEPVVHEWWWTRLAATEYISIRVNEVYRDPAEPEKEVSDAVVRRTVATGQGCSIPVG